MIKEQYQYASEAPSDIQMVNSRLVYLLMFDIAITSIYRCGTTICMACHHLLHFSNGGLSMSCGGRFRDDRQWHNTHYQNTRTGILAANVPTFTTKMPPFEDDYEYWHYI